MKISAIFISILFMFLWVIPPAAAHAAALLFIPLDDRPVCRDYVIDTAEKAGFTVLTPPAEWLASRGRLGQADKLWQWLEENWSQADYAVIAADSLIYGGLVDSRVHHLDYSLLASRVERFAKLKEQNPAIRVYVFSTIMRSPKVSLGGVEPSYYETYGRQIFKLTALSDKEVVKGLSGPERQTLQELVRSVPAEYLRDWLDRRTKNMMVNEDLVDLLRDGTIDYLIVGRDDSATFSQSHREWRLLKQKTTDLSISQFQSFPGADQLAMVLVARSYNDREGKLPIVQTIYTPGVGGNTIPAYEDQPARATIDGHVVAAGGIVLPQPQKPDLALLVNTPEDGHTREASDGENGLALSEEKGAFVDEVKQRVAQKEPVALADIAFANGSDNALMLSLEKNQLLPALTAYAGWNTASNTVGYAIGQGMMAPSMTPAARRDLLAVRYLDEWAYQANLRDELMDYFFAHDERAIQFLDRHLLSVTKEAAQQEQDFAKEHFAWVNPQRVQVSFPWNRLFEIAVSLDSDTSQIGKIKQAAR
ncbi:MAG: DUF4127 family protein [Sporomusaceae bacterium]|nr:DUF4127 family protein [Sporomusaceae bacterium]